MIIPSIALSGIRSRCFFINRKPDLSRPSRRRSYTSPVARHPEHTHGCERRGPGPRSTGMGMALLQRHRHMPIVPPMIMDGVRTAVVHNRMSRDAALSTPADGGIQLPRHFNIYGNITNQRYKGGNGGIPLASKQPGACSVSQKVV